MLNILLFALGNIFCGIFPLLLTLKVLNGKSHDGISAQVTFNQTQYLLNYWICYIVIRFIQHNLLLNTVSRLGIGTVINAMFLILKFWLFYGHGCLFFNYYYAKNLAMGILGNNCSSFDVFETKVVEPFVRSMVVKNPLVVLLINAMNKTFGHFKAINDILSEVSYFYLSIPNNQSFLQYSLDYICYIDTPANLNGFIVKTKENINTYFSMLNIGTSLNVKPTRIVQNEKENIPLHSFRWKGRRPSNSPTRCISPRNVSGGNIPEKYKIRHVPSEPSSHIASPNLHIKVKSHSKEEDLPFPLLHLEKRYSPVSQTHQGRITSNSKSSSRNSSNCSSDAPYPVSEINNIF